MSTILKDQRAALMVLSSVIEPGDADLDDLVGAVGPVGAVEALWTGQVTGRLARQSAAAVAAGPDPAARAAALQAATEVCGARVVIPGDLEWPTHVAHLARLSGPDSNLRPPLCLWVRGLGSLSAMSACAVAIVGARAATEYGQHVSDNLASGLADADWTVVAGGSLGIEKAAHLGSLARGGPTVAVLACGVDRPYPQANRTMFDLMVRNGLLVSEWPPGAVPMRSRFVARARLIAALSVGTVVVESGERSGALRTARLAASLGRTVMFTPGPVTSSQSVGVHRLAREPWGARLVTGAEEVIADLTLPGGNTQQQPSTAKPFDHLTEVEQWLVAALPRGYAVEDERIAVAVGITTGAAAEALPRLRDSGWVEQIEGRWRLRTHTEP